MKPASIILIAAILAISCTPANALEINLKNSLILGGTATGLLGLSMGFIKGGDSDDLYDQYLSATTDTDAISLFAQHDEAVDSSNTWYTIGFAGIGLSAAAYLVDRFYLSDNESISLESNYSEEGPVLALNLKY